jgi:hypothetical protein
MQVHPIRWNYMRNEAHRKRSSRQLFYVAQLLLAVLFSSSYRARTPLVG